MITAWVAMSSALSAGGLVALASMFDAIMAGVGIGWLIGINVAEGAIDEEDEQHEYVEEREMATAH